MNLPSRSRYCGGMARLLIAVDAAAAASVALATARSRSEPSFGDPEQPLIPWVDAIARYKYIDSFRRRSRRETLHDELDEEDELFVARDIAAVAEARYDLAKLLQQLPDRQRLPILYVKIEGGSVADAAKRTGMSESAVKVGIHRGLKALALKVRSIS